MRKLYLLLALAVVAGLFAAGFFFYQRQRFASDLEQARTRLGTHSAAEFLQRLAKRQPDHPEVNFLRARQFRIEGHNAEALESLRRASERGWPRPEIERELLLVRSQIDFPRVQPELQARLDGSPGDRDLLLALSLGWSRQQNLQRGEELVNAVLERDPDDGAARCIRGGIRLRKHQPHEALPDLEEAMNRGPDQYYYADARLLQATCLLELGKFAEALDLFRQCRQEEPNNPRVLFGIGRCAWYLDHWDEAAAAFREVLRLRPDHLDALSQLAYLHEERGELAEALPLLERALRADPTWYDLHFRIAKILRALGQNERADEHLKRAELVKKHWAKPRPGSARGGNSYTGEEPELPRTAERQPSNP